MRALELFAKYSYVVCSVLWLVVAALEFKENDIKRCIIYVAFSVINVVLYWLIKRQEQNKAEDSEDEAEDEAEAE